MAKPRSGRKRKSSIANESASKKQKNYEINLLDNGNGGGSGSATTRIDALPNDVLVEIVKLLPTTQWPYLERVSHGFQEAVFEAWRGLRKVRLTDDFLIDDAKQKANPIRVLNWILKKLIDRAPNTTELSAFSSGGVCDLDRTSIRLLSRLDNLQSVDFSDCKMRMDKMANFLETSRSRGLLKELKIEQFGFLEQRDQVILRSAFGNENSNLPPLKLEKLRLIKEYCGIFEFEGAMDVSRLTTFDVDSVISAADLTSLITRATNLTNLGFSFQNGCEIENVGVYLAENRGLFQAITTLKNLSSLKIGLGIRCGVRCSQIRSVFVEMIAELGRRRRLEEFSLLNDDLCTAEAVSAIADNMASLKSLELCRDIYCTAAPFLQLVTKLTRLEKLLFPTNWDIVDDDLISAIAANLFNLKCLSFRYSDWGKSNTLKNLATLVNLKKLQIKRMARLLAPVAYGTTMNGWTMKAWGKGFGSKLETLKLASCIDVSDKSLIALIKKTPRLRKLTANGLTTALSNHLLREIASSCPELRELRLKSRSNKLTTKGVQAIVDGCSQLKRIKGIGNGWREKVNLEKYREVKFD